jgi:hypothetical protein
MRLLKMLIVASLIAIATIEAWPYVASSRTPAPPRPGKRLVTMGQTLIRRIAAPIAARRARPRDSRWR